MKKPTFNISAKVAPFPRKKFEKFLSYLKVQSHDFGRIPFKLLGSQRYILDEVEKGISEGVTTFVILKSRHIGSTTVFIAIDMMYAFENGGLMGTFILHEEKALDRWRAIIDIFLETLPKKILIGGKKVKFRPDVIRHSRNLLWLSNDSMFSYLIAGTDENKAGGLGRSGSSNFVHATECAFYGSEEDIKAFKAQVSSIYAHRLQIYESTANGFNHWYDTCQTAKDSPTMRFIFVGWWRCELFALHTTDPRYQHFMPDEKLTMLERQRVRAVKEQYDFQITLQQIAWYRWKMFDEFSSDQVTMDQEFPWTEEDAFQSGKSKFFDGTTLTQVTRDAITAGRELVKTIGVPYQGYRYKVTNRWEEIDVVAFNDPRSELHVWEHASKFGYYVIGVDPNYGSGPKADWGVATVWRAYSECIVQVAEFCSKSFSTYQLAWVIAHLAGFYGQNDCRVNIELTGGSGMTVYDELKRLRSHLNEMRPQDDSYGIRNCLKHMSDYYYQRIDNVGGGDLAYHTRMSADIRGHLMTQFKDGIELRRMQPRSMVLIEQMRRLANEDGHIEASEGHDDHVMAAALAYETWQKWLAPKLRSLHMTRARAAEIEVKGGDKPITQLMINYLKRSNITVPTT